MTSELLIAPEFATPLRLLWKRYKESCALWGFPQATVEEFVRWIGDEEDMRIIRRGSGRVRAMVLGVAPRQETDRCM